MVIALGQAARPSPRVLVSALLLDLLFGEPRNLHPVRGMGVLIARFRKGEAARSRSGKRLRGAAFAALGSIAAAGTVAIITRAIMRAQPSVREMMLATLLKPSFAIRELFSAATRVRRALAASQLVHARQELGHHLVSRPTHDLSASEVAGATIESIAENLTDSVVAPLTFYALAGLPTSYAYRFLNTADAMIGYRTPELVEIGWASARLDDAFNYLPARWSAACIALAAPVGGGSIAAAWQAAVRDSTVTESPNAGWTMAAMAGALGVRLSKREHYTLNVRGREPTAGDIDRALRIAACALSLAVTGLAIASARSRA